MASRELWIPRPQSTIPTRRASGRGLATLYKNREERFWKSSGSAYPECFKLKLEEEGNQILSSNPKHKPHGNQPSGKKEEKLKYKIGDIGSKHRTQMPIH